MVRILRSTLMVRVGGGWTALDEFLVKNDPVEVNISHLFTICLLWMKQYADSLQDLAIFCVILSNGSHFSIRTNSHY